MGKIRATLLARIRCVFELELHCSTAWAVLRYTMLSYVISVTFTASCQSYIKTLGNVFVKKLIVHLSPEYRNTHCHMYNMQHSKKLCINHS